MQSEAKEMKSNLINQKDSIQELESVYEDLKKLSLKLRTEKEEILTDVEYFLEENMLLVEDNLQSQGLTREKFESIEADLKVKVVQFV